jgi:hypothetical protein
MNLCGSTGDRVTGWNSTIPSVLSALFTLWSNAPALSTVTVTDGPTTSNVGATSQMVTVGYNGDSDEAVVGTTDAEGFSWDPSRENYTVLCSAAAVTEGDDQAAARDEAFTLYKACCDALLADPTLGGVVLSSRPGDCTVRQPPGDLGRGCLILFGINVTAYTT